jgi:hypothetical protein
MTVDDDSRSIINDSRSIINYSRIIINDSRVTLKMSRHFYDKHDDRNMFIVQASGQHLCLALVPLPDNVIKPFIFIITWFVRCKYFQPSLIFDDEARVEHR